MSGRKLISGPGIELWIATIGIGAFPFGRTRRYRPELATHRDRPIG